jgi:hypothetical protein
MIGRSRDGDATSKPSLRDPRQRLGGTTGAIWSGKMAGSGGSLPVVSRATFNRARFCLSPPAVAYHGPKQDDAHSQLTPARSLVSDDQRVKVKLRLGWSVVEYEGSEAYLRSEIPNLLEALDGLKANRLPFYPEPASTKDLADAMDAKERSGFHERNG